MGDTKGKVRILNSSGDTTLVVDGEPDVGGRRVTEAEARDIVARHVSEGGLAYKKGPDAPEQVREYDPSAQETVLSPRMAGGC